MALPYWEFDKPAPKLFSEAFIGRVDPASDDPTLVRFTPGGPMDRWRLTLTDRRVSPLRRLRNGEEVDEDIDKSFMGFDQHGDMTVEIFGPYHGEPHIHIGGLVGDIQRSPADPLFFLLHANVDRAWAGWQRFYGRFNRVRQSDYFLQNGHVAGSPFPFGNFAEDTMWPWDGIVRPTEPGTDPNRPDTLTTNPVMLPANPGPGAGLTDTPEVGDALDYLDMAGVGASHGFCYDSFPYGVGEVDAFWKP